jgi:hypothetical protein
MTMAFSFIIIYTCEYNIRWLLVKPALVLFPLSSQLLKDPAAHENFLQMAE